MSTETPTDEEPFRREYEEVELEDHETFRDRLIRGLKEDKLAFLGGIVVVVFVFTALFAPYVAPHPEGAYFNTFQEPNSVSNGDFDDDGTAEAVYHPLGTDSYGRDMLSRLIYGSRVSLFVAAATVFIAFTLGTTIGLVAGYYGGWIDDVLMRYVDFQWAFPELILAIGIIAYLGGLGITNVIIAISLAYIDDFARLIRGEVLSLREEEYIQAARAVGMSNTRIMMKEILPNAVAPLIVQATLMIPLAILAEAGLSFLGLGVKATTPTWGLMLNQGMTFMNQAWWISIMPGIAIMIIVLGFNMFGDGLRDAFDISETEV
jgi:peptide/nickel transport system permease protein